MKFTWHRMAPMIAGLLCCAFLLAACASLYDYEYYEKTPHTEDEYDESDPAEATVADFLSLKQAVLRMIRGGLTEGSLRAVGYQGDFSRDLDIALKEVRNLEPLGAYAVDYMTGEMTSLPPQTFAVVYISYRQAATLQTVQQANGAADLRALLENALQSYQKTLVVEMSYYSAEQHNIAAMLEQAYFDHPLYAMGRPAYTVNRYPTDAEDYMPRILEIHLEHWDTAEVLAEREQACAAALDSLLEQRPGDLGEAESLLWLHDRLTELIVYDQGTVINDYNTGIPQKIAAYTLYGALAEGFAVSEGYALSLKLGCDRLGIECIIVSGRRSNYDHKWNLVRLDGDWYHVDTAANDSDPAPTHDWFLLGDEDMDIYSWGGAYPPAPPAPLDYDQVAGIVPPNTEQSFPAETPMGEDGEQGADHG